MSPRACARVRVTINQLDVRSVVTDSEGKYRVSGLSPGKLEEVEVRAAGHTVLFADDVTSCWKQVIYWGKERTSHVPPLPHEA